ncbi:MAG: FecR domain-containing protein [Nitrospirae bacterium]|nr:FecR domain-containing protein [Nitrospirota bacterium]
MLNVSGSSAISAKTFGTVTLKGDVFIKTGKKDWAPFKEYFSLVGETDIKTANGTVSVSFIDGSLIDVSKETVIYIKGSSSDYAVQIEKGIFAFNIDPSASLAVLTSSARVLIGGKEMRRKSGDDKLKRYMGVVSADGLGTDIKSVSGMIPVTIKNETMTISPREKIFIDLKGKHSVAGIYSNNLFLGSDAADKVSVKAVKDPGSEYIGKVIYLKANNTKGSVSITRKGKKRALKMNEGVLINDVIETGVSSRAKISFVDDSLLTLNESSRLTVKNFLIGKEGKRGDTVFSLEKGQARSVVGKNELQIHTKTGIAAARGTVIILEVIDGESRLYVIENEATYTFFTPDGLSEIIHGVDEGYMFGDGMTEPLPIPPYKLLDIFETAVIKKCNYCQKLDALGVCVPDLGKDPGPCMRCVDGEEVADDTEDPGSCKKCDGGKVIDDDTEDPGPCRKCLGGKEIDGNTEDPGPCKKCWAGKVGIDNSKDPGTCQKCENGNPVIDDRERPGRCQKCENGKVVPDLSGPGECPVVPCNICQRVNEEGVCVPDNERDPGICLKCGDGISVPDDLEDPGVCFKCQGGARVIDNLEDPGMCRKCEAGADIADNFEDPGMCKRCEAGAAVTDNLEDPGMCKKCEAGLAVADDLEDPGLCKKCQGGAPVADNLEDPGMCLKCSGGIPVADNLEDPGICYKCFGGASVVDDFEPCDDNDVCSMNDHCLGGICIGDRDPSPVDPACSR